METTITHNLDNEDDRKAHLRCIKSTQLALSIMRILSSKEEFKEHLLRMEFISEYDKKINETKLSFCDEIFSKFEEILKENKIDLEEML